MKTGGVHHTHTTTAKSAPLQSGHTLYIWTVLQYVGLLLYHLTYKPENQGSHSIQTHKHLLHLGIAPDG